MLAQRDEEIREANSNVEKLQYSADLELRIDIEYDWSRGFSGRNNAWIEC